MRIVTYQYEYIGNSSGTVGYSTTLIDIPLIEWWSGEMRQNEKNAKEYETAVSGGGRGPGYYKTTALIFSEEIPDGEYEDIEWYPTPESDQS